MIVPPPAGGRWYAVPKGERVLKFDAPSARGDGGGFAMGHSVARVQRIQAAIGLRPGRPGFGPGMAFVP